jgi:hypothetical protein
VHFRSSRVREADVDAAGDQGPDQAFRTIHGCTLSFWFATAAKTSLFGARVKRFAR